MSDNKKPPVQGGLSNITQEDFSIKKPVRIPNKLLGSIVNTLPKRAKQGRRTIHKLGVHPDSRTGHVNPFAGVNISDIRQRYNKFIRPFGYEMKCREPDKPILDLDGDVSGQKLWGLYPIASTDLSS